MRNLEFRAWNSKSEIMLSWGLLRVSPILLSKLIKGSVDNHTIEQFTGLLDKNGTKIFEGDIVRHRFTDRISTVKYSEFIAAFDFGVNDYVSCQEAGLDSEWLEVIGNIHEGN